MDLQDFVQQGEGREEDKLAAWHLFQQAYECQMRGELEEAITLYKRSIELFPTAEAHTFLGWTYSFLGQLHEAIEECHRAIQTDPDFGNPYNDIGAYLIELDQLDEAIPWLEKATQAKRYECPAFPYMNLGRIYERKGEWEKAIDCYKEAVTLNPQYRTAKKALMRLVTLMN
ncbi:MAG: tetratricopeptide repeat protein [Nitrospirae bacterium]|nr:MAG: tetratricopeptide repeat protein [Nitrospirota bacterium]